ncbi:hypothetical protein D9O36_15615 [Zobellia amurskyensis]|uniref:Uncharacterized protein n=1 Tax=Zobellia amurskyensis TaxID=248905 RepID=A0A7X3D347_9FLAO|nr:hypothetical protein [Zobellia amurskyensis]
MVSRGWQFTYSFKSDIFFFLTFPNQFPPIHFLMVHTIKVNREQMKLINYYILLSIAVNPKAPTERLYLFLLVALNGISFTDCQKSIPFQRI